MNLVHLALKYSLFALLATLANLAAQELSIRQYQGSYAIYLAMGLGTLAGLTCKYLLDKRYIFAVRTDSLHQDLRLFLVYGLTGVFTTLLFWCFELGFEFWIGGKTARYTGAIIGLAIGYVVKYQLDKRFVFSH